MSWAREASQLRATARVAASTSREEPILTTTRRAWANAVAGERPATISAAGEGAAGPIMPPP
ncbi:hypothetical protein D3C80_751270 [compost metagenome]